MKETGPDIFVQGKLLMSPSGSLESLLLNDVSVGKAITWSGSVIGGLSMILQ